MALSFQFNFGRLLNKGERITNAKLNAIVKGVSGLLSGTVGNADLGAASVDPSKVQQGPYFYSTATLAASTYTGAWTPSVTSYVDGLVLCFKASAGNAGAVNLDAGSGAKPLRKWNGKGLESGDIGTGQLVCVRYNTTLVAGGCWELIGLPGQPMRDDYRYGGSAAMVGGTGATPSDYTVTCVNAPAAYVTGMVVSFNAGTNNGGTGGARINVNGLGLKELRHNQDGLYLNALESGRIVGGMLIVCQYDGTYFQVISPLERVYASAEPVVASGRNIVVKSNTGSPTTKVDIAADELTLKDGSTGKTILLSGVSLTADITLGVALNGLDAGVEAVSTWYYLYVIGISPAFTASLISTSATAPTLPAGYTYKALVGVVYNDAGSNFVTFWQQGRQVFVRDTANAVFTATAGVNGTWTSQALTAFVPPIAKRVRGRIGIVLTAGNNWAASVAGDNAGLGALGGGGVGANVTQDGFSGAAPYDAPLATAQTVWWNSGNNLAAAYRLSVSGYEI